MSRISMGFNYKKINKGKWMQKDSHLYDRLFKKLKLV